MRALWLAGVLVSLLGLAACGSGDSTGEGDDPSGRKQTRPKEPPRRQANDSPQRPTRRSEDAQGRRERPPGRGAAKRRGQGPEKQPQRGDMARRLRERQQALDEHRDKLPQERCHPSYDPCLDPGASDYDCAGSGDGPSYAGPVTVKGEDAYDLDTDGDGKACAP